MISGLSGHITRKDFFSPSPTLFFCQWHSHDEHSERIATASLVNWVLSARNTGSCLSFPRSLWNLGSQLHFNQEFTLQDSWQWILHQVCGRGIISFPGHRGIHLSCSHWERLHHSRVFLDKTIIMSQTPEKTFWGLNGSDLKLSEWVGFKKCNNKSLFSIVVLKSGVVIKLRTS